MGPLGANLKSFVTATAVSLCFVTQLAAQGANVDDLFLQLETSDAQTAPKIEAQILQVWSDSGSPSMNVLLQRGQAALRADDPKTAVLHLTALTDHAPEFAEGWHALGAAYFVLGQIGPAADALERAMRLEPRHFLAMAGYVAVLEELGQYEAALRLAILIQDLHPQFKPLPATLDRLRSQGNQQIL